MNSMNNYNKKQQKIKVFPLIMLIVVLAIMGYGVLLLLGAFDEPDWKPAAEFPMANANISWKQTYHAGAWGDGL